MNGKGQIGVRVDQDLIKRIEKLASAQRRGFSDMVRILLEDALDKYPITMK